MKREVRWQREEVEVVLGFPDLKKLEVVGMRLPLMKERIPRRPRRCCWTKADPLPLLLTTKSKAADPAPARTKSHPKATVPPLSPPMSASADPVPLPSSKERPAE